MEGFICYLGRNIGAVSTFLLIPSGLYILRPDWHSTVALKNDGGGGQSKEVEPRSPNIASFFEVGGRVPGGYGFSR